MVERGNTTHGPALDDKMKQETQALRHGNQSGHVEEWRETEPLPDDTDSPEIRESVRENLPAGESASTEAGNDNNSTETPGSG
ncbi:hypothetical protein [Arthrobacter rhizosphaerae]|uniref:hypothetical protein n=1 Tax=Arthrobacter rhizosphaerae TaxID=2855490 RepID=UPI001FF5FC62|nr:hypothetical protein [Arthrobacter rhizosphaerae]